MLSMMKMNKISRRLELSLSLAKAEFKLRNEGSYLGILWYLLDPLLLFTLLLLVFSDRLGTDIADYPLYLLLGIIMFNFFQKATIESTKVIYDNRWIIKSINFPRKSLISAVVLKTFFSHIFEIILFIAFALFFQISVARIVFYPLILLFFCIFIFGACLMLSALTIYFADLKNIWAFASRLIWLGTPIFYAIEGQKRLLYLNLFNPMYYFITIARDVMVYGKLPQDWMILGMIGYSLLFLAIGLLVFNKLKNKFAELI